jgi:hypothetical protein
MQGGEQAAKSQENNATREKHVEKNNRIPEFIYI